MLSLRYGGWNKGVFFLEDDGVIFWLVPDVVCLSAAEGEGKDEVTPLPAAESPTQLILHTTCGYAHAPTVWSVIYAITELCDVASNVARPPPPVS